MRNRYRSVFNYLFAVMCIMVSVSPLLSQEDTSSGAIENDSSETAFREGRWTLGLTGTISSGTLNADTTINDGFSNEYSINISAEKFVIDRLAVGLIFSAERRSQRAYVDRDIEILFVGPVSTYYFSDSRQGSVYVSGSIGYSRFRDQTNGVRDGQPFSDTFEGQGIGLFGETGYALTIADRIVFNVGLGVTSNWIWSTRELLPGGTISKEKLQIGRLAFSFGFSVLL